MRLQATTLCAAALAACWLLALATCDAGGTSGKEEAQAFYTCQHYYNSSLWLPRLSGDVGDDDDDADDDEGRDVRAHSAALLLSPPLHRACECGLCGG